MQKLKSDQNITYKLNWLKLKLQFFKMDGEEKRENSKISFVERINRESGRPVEEDPKKNPNKEVWVLEDVTSNEYASDLSSAGGRKGSSSSWVKKGRNLFEELFFEGIDMLRL